VLLMGTAAALLLAPGGRTVAARLRSAKRSRRRDILQAYPDRDPGRRLYRSLRLALGGYGEVVRRLPRHGLVVDLGAGEGLLAHVLVRSSPDLRVLAVDHDAARVERLQASARGLPIEAVAADFTTFPIPACDAVVLLDVLHYLPSDAQEAVLRRAASALRPGGTLLLRDPDAGAGARFAWNAFHESLATRLDATQARVSTYRTGRSWAVVAKVAGLANPRMERLASSSPYADRVVAAAAPPPGARYESPEAPAPASGSRSRRVPPGFNAAAARRSTASCASEGR